MEKIKITICMNNPNYGQILAKGLCIEYAGLDILLAKDMREALNNLEKRLLVTDILGVDLPRIIYFDAAKKLLPLKTIMEEICEKYQELFMEETVPLTESYGKTFAIYSQKGGSGVTSLAITMARLISVKTGSDVLYLNLGSFDDYEKFTDVSFEGCNTKMQYHFMKTENLHILRGNYFRKDLWNVFYFKPETEANFLLNNEIEKSILGNLKREFDYIILDFGKKLEIKEDFFDAIFEIIVKKDNRILSNERIERKLRAKIFGKAEESLYEVSKDEECFGEMDEKVEISMGSHFARSIEHIVDSCEILLH